jgi:mono/diheme cytochrome c family protein
MPKELCRFAEMLILILFLTGIFLTISLYRAAVAHSPTGWKAPAKERKVKNPVSDNLESRRGGRKIYAEKCASCHGKQGEGRGELSKSLNPPPPDLTNRHMMEEMSDGEIFWKITTGKGAMPSYKKELTAKERWDLVNYIKSLAQPK